MRTIIASLVALAVTALPSVSFAFGPCSNTMPRTVSYYPSVTQCGGKAAIILNGELRNSFSVVLRACDNGDRDPCYKSINSCGTNASSPFKVQKTVDAVVKVRGVTKSARIFCLKEAGNSYVYKMVRRLTIKRVNPVRNTATDVLKICLPSRTQARNLVEVVSTGAVRGVGNTGINSQCFSQKYLGCDLTQALKKTCSF